MKIEKAIEILQANLDYNTFIRLPDDRNAIKLGEEALKRLQGIRGLDASRPINLLPGETKD